jgi:hypothetical protein
MSTGVPRGKLLGYVITKRDIEANPDNISVIAEIGQVRNVKDVQCCFVSRLGERGLPLYRLFKKSDSFRWTDETHKAFDNLNTFISKPSVLASPKPSETLLL